MLSDLSVVSYLFSSPSGEEIGRTTLSGEELRETCENELELEDLHHLMWLYRVKDWRTFML